MIININNGKTEQAGAPDLKNSVKILFIGDVCPRYRVEKPVINGEGAEILAPAIKILTDKDLSIANLEAPLTRSERAIPKSGPNIKLDPGCVDLLTAAKIDIANLANNHIGDYGSEGVLETIDTLNQNGIAYVGAGKCVKDARKPLLINKKGLSISVLSYAENEFTIADKNKPGASPLDTISNLHQVREEAGRSDIVIVLIHGGNEYCPFPSPRMVQLYREFANAGASAVIGTHPHCPQGFEIYKGVPVIYSLGNFLFDISSNSKSERSDQDGLWWKGYMARICFNSSGAAELEIIPHTFHGHKKLRALENEQKEQFIKYLEHISGIIQNDEELKSWWYAWCMYMAPEFFSYLEGLSNPVSKDEDTFDSRLLAVRNIFSCEAHNEVMTTILKMICDRKEGKWKELISRIEKLQKGIIA